MPDAARVEVTGLPQLRRALKQAEGRSPKELQQANKQAAELVAGVARLFAPKGEHEGGGDVQPLASAIVAQATAGKAFVAFGGSRAPHGAVVNFGGSIPRRGATRVQKAAFAKARKAKKSQAKVAAITGAQVTRVPRQEHVYRAIGASRDQTVRVYERAVDRITRDL